MLFGRLFDEPGPATVNVCLPSCSHVCGTTRSLRWQESQHGANRSWM